MGLAVAIFAMFNIFFSDMLSIKNPLYIVGLAIVAVIGYFLVSVPLQKAGKIKS